MLTKRLQGQTNTQIASGLEQMSEAERASMFADLDIMEYLTAEIKMLREENMRLLARIGELETRVRAYEEQDAQLADVRVALQNIGYDHPDCATRSIHVRRAIYQMS
jgi:putative hemolysin